MRCGYCIAGVRLECVAVCTGELAIVVAEQNTSVSCVSQGRGEDLSSTVQVGQ